jgi:hypothetical protein
MVVLSFVFISSPFLCLWTAMVARGDEEVESGVFLQLSDNMKYGSSSC